MSFSYSAKSTQRLATCDERLQLVFNETLALGLTDISIIEGHRSLEQQQSYFERGLSTLDGINLISKHQSNPSLAVDAVPYPIDWHDTGRFALFAGVVLSVAKANGIELIWGGDWDKDFTSSDHTFFDGPHFELVD